MEHGEYTKAIARLCKIRKNRNLKPSFSTIEGPEHAADVMASHLQTIYSGRLLQGVEEDHLSFYNSPPFSQETCPILLNDVKDALRQLPPKKAPGPDHIRQEMLTPLQPTLAPILLFLFQLCWTWSYTPAEWRLAQIIPIYKKGDPTEPGNHRPISLTSVFRKLLERSIHHFLIDHSPPLDIAQGGFRESRGSLDQALCLAEACNILRRHYRITPVLAFLDIKSAYDTVDRRQIWRTLEKTAPVALVSLLRNLFDEVQIEVLLNNATSTRFSPITGVLQGSILSPFLYSVYINELPQILRPHPISSDLTPTDLILRLNCLLYADDVVLIATKDDMGTLLQSCENHSYQLGYRWNPSKCVILDSSQSSSSYTLYGEKIPRHSSFPYLGIPFRPGGYLDTVGLVNRNKTKALATMNQLSAIGVHPKGFAHLLATRFYKQIVRAQLEYGLAITKITTFLSKQLEEAQNTCLRRIFGGSRTSSTTVMLHMSNLPTMQERAYALQSQFLLRSFTLPEDALLHHLLPLVRQSRSYSQWYKLSKSPIWKRCSSNPESLDRRSLRSIQREYRQDNLNHKRSMNVSVLLMHCRPIISLDPVLWLPMSKSERSRCIRWRLGWLPGGRYKTCPRHPDQCFTKAHAIHCLQMHRRLMMPETISDPLSFLLNILPARKPRSFNTTLSWTLRWPIICTILYELDYLHHTKHLSTPPTHLGQRLLEWLPSSPSH